MRSGFLWKPDYDDQKIAFLRYRESSNF